MLIVRCCCFLQDLSVLRVDSPNAIATVLAVLASVIVPAVIAKRSSTTTLFLWNGLLCLLSGAVTFYTAVSPDLRFTWETGDPAFDELLGTVSPIFPFDMLDLMLTSARLDC